MTDLQIQYLLGQVVDREETVARQAAEIGELRKDWDADLLMKYAEQKALLNETEMERQRLNNELRLYVAAVERQAALLKMAKDLVAWPTVITSDGGQLRAFIAAIEAWENGK